MKLLTAIVFATVASVPTVLSAQSTQRLTANKSNEYGLIYNLPLTAVDITVETATTVSTPGEFANYANRHLGLQDAVRTPSRTVEVRSISISTHGVIDPDNRWLVQFKNGSNVSMTLTEGGMPLTINTEKVADEPTPKLPEAVPAPVSPLATDAARQAVTQEMSRSTSPAKKAELAAQRIFEMREQRNELISGNADNMPADGGALKVALDAMDAQEAALTAMFAGTRLSGTQVSTFTFVPGDEDVADTLVARISPVDGITDTDDLRGIPLTVSVKVMARGELPVNEKGEVKKFPKGGVAYNIPGSAEITVRFNDRDIATAIVDLAQLGSTFGIDPALFSDKKAPMCARFSSRTGALLSLDPVSEQ